MRRLLLLLVLIPSFLFATENYPIKVVNNKRYYEYTVQAGEGLFAIARKFNVKQADIHEANTNLEDGLKAGQVLLIPIAEEETTTPQKEITHTVEAKQTLFAISRLYDISIDELIALNPKSVDGLKVGDVLIIRKGADTASNVIAPVEQDKSVECKKEPVVTLIDSSNVYVIHEVQRRETLYSISKLYQVSIDEIVELNPNIVNQQVKVGQKLRIPVKNADNSMVKFVDNDTKKAAIHEPLPAETIPTTTPDLTVNAADGQVMNISVLLPFMSDVRNLDGSADRFIEFYKGVLLALEKIKESGVNIKVNTYDVGKQVSGVDSVLHLPEFSNTNLIIGPAYTVQVPVVSSYARRNKVMTIVPFTSKISAEDSNAYIYQFNPSHEHLYPIIGDDLLKRGISNFLFVNVPDASNKGVTFANNFKRLVEAKGKHIENFYVGVDSVYTLRQKLSNKPTMIIYGSSEMNDVQPIMNEIKGYNLANLSQWGYEEWTPFMSQYSNFYYHSLFNAIPTEAYTHEYEHWFGKRHRVEVPRYDMLGFDLTYYFLSGMEYTNKHWVFSAPKAQLELMQSEPYYQQVSDGLWMNLNYYLFYYDGYETKIVNTQK